jgi:hypothetical protein
MGEERHGQRPPSGRRRGLCAAAAYCCPRRQHSSRAGGHGHGGSATAAAGGGACGRRAAPAALVVETSPHTARLSCYLRPLLKSEKGSAGVSKSPTSLKSGFQQQQLPSQLRRLLVFPRQRPPSRTPQLRRGAATAAGCERSSARPCGGRSTLPAYPRLVVSGASSRW